MNGQEMEQALRKAERRYQRALARAEMLRHERDEVIREASAWGMSHAEIRWVLGGNLTRARIGQITTSAR